MADRDGDGDDGAVDGGDNYEDEERRVQVGGGVGAAAQLVLVARGVHPCLRPLCSLRALTPPG